MEGLAEEIERLFAEPLRCDWEVVAFCWSWWRVRYDRKAASGRRRPSRAVQPTCKHGHSWAEHGRVEKSGIRKCSECHRRRARESWHRRKLARVG